jgi:hypothetical protein
MISQSLGDISLFKISIAFSNASVAGDIHLGDLVRNWNIPRDRLSYTGEISFVYQDEKCFLGGCIISSGRAKTAPELGDRDWPLMLITSTPVAWDAKVKGRLDNSWVVWKDNAGTC